MARRPDPDRPTRSTARLSREAIVDTGIAVADREGLDAVSMRRLGAELDANPMSLYHHVGDKDGLLGAMVETVVARIAPDWPGPGDPERWTQELRSLILAARGVMVAHPWAVDVIQQHPATGSVLVHIERLLAILRGAGCDVDLAHHALHLLGSRMLGFSQDPFTVPAGGGASPEQVVLYRSWAETLPHVVELATAAAHDGGLGGCDDEEEFGFALDVLLDGLERRRLADAART
ncbi:TetR/AcrR family transcriptional regulator [Actinotalea sp. M2MS4P-6]|uniref:TetR/AcrR family transcriptional regulator n=1 Tax=Actinotalea sp. M2MS4P-6 TaxID=2983762 RepID=UPI0021E380FE|nr:TetR/AcrR family transcriptional regulator [Actinotalea sp. M2MS4P-6]MCV2393663.1 TetR/AcrR family transcriptional regulator [Actinotalea sp. M2MS4P-6]